MARDDGAQFRIAGGHEPRDVGELGRILREAEDREIGLVDRGVEREVGEQRRMPVVEDGETVLERDEERRGGAAVGAGRERVVVRARRDLERSFPSGRRSAVEFCDPSPSTPPPSPRVDTAVRISRTAIATSTSAVCFFMSGRLRASRLNES